MDDKPKKKRTLSKLAIDELKQIQKQQIQPPIDEPNKIATKGKGEPISTDKPVSKYIADIFAGEQSPEQAKGDATPDNLKKLFATDISKIPVKDVEGKEVSQDIVKLSKPQDFFTKQNQIEDDARDKLEKGLEQLDNLDPKGLLNTVNGLIGATALPFTTLDNILRHLPKGGTDFHGKPNYGVGDYIADVIGSPAKLVEQLYPFVKGSVKSGFNIGGGAVPIMAEYVKDRYDISGESPEVDEFAKNILTILAYSGLTKIGDTYKGKNLKDPAILNSIKNDLNSGVKVGKIIETLEQDKKITEKAIDEATTPEERLSALNTAKKITEKQEELKETLLTPSEQLLKELKGEKKTGETKSNEETKVEAKPTVEEKPAEVKKEEEVKPTKVEESVSKDAPILEEPKSVDDPLVVSHRQPPSKIQELLNKPLEDITPEDARTLQDEHERIWRANYTKSRTPTLRQRHNVGELEVAKAIEEKAKLHREYVKEQRNAKVEAPPIVEPPKDEGNKRPKKTNEGVKVKSEVKKEQVEPEYDVNTKEEVVHEKSYFGVPTPYKFKGHDVMLRDYPDRLFRVYKTRNGWKLDEVNKEGKGLQTLAEQDRAGNVGFKTLKEGITKGIEFLKEKEGVKEPQTEKSGENTAKKYRVDRSPQTWTLVKEEPRQKGDLPEERFFLLKNDKTGKVERFESADLKPVKEKKQTDSTEQRQIERIQKQIEKIQKQAGDNEIAKDEARLRINKLKTRLEQLTGDEPFSKETSNKADLDYIFP